MSASLPQWLQIAVPLIFCREDADDSGLLRWSFIWADSGKVQVTTISASLPQASHLQTCLIFFSVWVIAVSFFHDTFI
jgi:hypothetical protein